MNVVMLGSLNPGGGLVNQLSCNGIAKFIHNTSTFRLKLFFLSTALTDSARQALVFSYSLSQSLSCVPVIGTSFSVWDDGGEQ